MLGYKVFFIHLCFNMFFNTCESQSKNIFNFWFDYFEVKWGEMCNSRLFNRSLFIRDRKMLPTMVQWDETMKKLNGFCSNWLDQLKTVKRFFFCFVLSSLTWWTIIFIFGWLLLLRVSVQEHLVLTTNQFQNWKP